MAYKLDKTATISAIADVYDEAREFTMTQVRDKLKDKVGLSLGGDGWHDSRGWSASYCVYPCMDTESGKILDYELYHKVTFYCIVFPFFWIVFK